MHTEKHTEHSWNIRTNFHFWSILKHQNNDHILKVIFHPKLYKMTNNHLMHIRHSKIIKFF